MEMVVSLIALSEDGLSRIDGAFKSKCNWKQGRNIMVTGGRDTMIVKKNPTSAKFSRIDVSVEIC